MGKFNAADRTFKFRLSSAALIRDSLSGRIGKAHEFYRFHESNDGDRAHGDRNDNYHSIDKRGENEEESARTFL